MFVDTVSGAIKHKETRWDYWTLIGNRAIASLLPTSPISVSKWAAPSGPGRPTVLVRLDPVPRVLPWRRRFGCRCLADSAGSKAPPALGRVGPVRALGS